METEDQVDERVVERVEPGRVLVRPISQVVLRFKSSDSTERFNELVTVALRWLAGKSGRPLPEAAWRREKFELTEIGAQHVAAVAIIDPLYWAARVDDADKEVALRTWVTEISVAVEASGDVLFGTRLTCTMRGEILPVDRTLPSFVRQAINLGGSMLDGRQVSSKPWLICTENDVDELVDFLEDKKRIGSLVLLSTEENSDDVATTILPPDGLVRRVIGAAHVAVITSSASEMLVQRVGRDMSIYRQAIRVYKPGFHRFGDKPWRHLIYGARRILDWPEDGLIGFERWLASRALEETVHGAAVREERLPSFGFVRQAAAEFERKRSKAAGASPDEMLALFEEDNNQLRAALVEQAQKYDSLLIEAERERDEVLRLAQEEKALALSLRARLRSLDDRQKSSGHTVATPIPRTLEDFEDWCQAHLAGSVEVLGRALGGVKKSVYRDSALLYQALVLLRDFYVPMRRLGGKPRVEIFESECRKLGIENSMVGEAVKRYKEEYSVRWNGESRTLDWHLKSGDGREKTKCFRLYYFWDEEAECVVVGSMPAHLKNDLT